MLTFTPPMEVYFVIYKCTAEEMILDPMAEKMLSNQLLTGQEVGGALVPDDAGNMLQVAMNWLLKGVDEIIDQRFCLTEHHDGLPPRFPDDGKS